MRLDPLSEKFSHINPFNHSENEPVGSVDLHGLQRFELRSGDVNWKLIKAKSEVDRQNIKQENSRTVEELAPIAIAGTALMLGGTAFATFGVRATLAFAANEVKDEALSIATDGVSDYVDLTKMGIKSTKEFMKSNSKRINDKIGDKIGAAGDLPFEESKGGYEEALRTIEKTMETPSATSDPFKNRAGDEVIDIFSKETGMTVRVRTDGTFDTLIPEKTNKIKQ